MLNIQTHGDVDSTERSLTCLPIEIPLAFRISVCLSISDRSWNARISSGRGGGGREEGGAFIPSRCNLKYFPAVCLLCWTGGVGGMR